MLCRKGREKINTRNTMSWNAADILWQGKSMLLWVDFLLKYELVDLGLKFYVQILYSTIFLTFGNRIFYSTKLK